jgi:membrane protease YdiL (CAAX protease family)
MLFFKLALIRWKNRNIFRVIASFERKAGKNGPRSATPRKRKIIGVFSLLVGFLFLFNIAFLSSKFIRNFSRVGQENNPSKIQVSQWVYKILTSNEQNLKTFEKYYSQQDRTRNSRLNDIFYEAIYNAFLSDLNSSEENLEKSEKIELAARYLRIFKQYGSSKFTVSPLKNTLFSMNDVWPSQKDERFFLGGLNLVLGGIFVTLFFIILGNALYNLAKSEWDVEWFFTFPVPTWHLLFGKLVEYTFTNFLGFLFFFPFTSLCLRTSGKTWGDSVVLGLLSTLYLNALLASLRFLLETWLRKHIANNKIKNIQALCTLIGMLLFALIFWIISTPEIPTRFLTCLKTLTPWIFWIPTSFALSWCRETFLSTASILGGFLFIFVSGILILLQFLLRDGLIKSGGGGYEGKRNVDTATNSKIHFKNIVGKELRLIFRDKNLLMQTFFVPFFIIGLQVLINPTLKKDVLSNFNHTATLAFIFGAYSLMFGTFHVLTGEGQSLWILYTFPKSIAKMMLQKTLLWGILSLFYPCLILSFAILSIPELRSIDLLNGILAIVGVFIYAFVAGGMGVISSDPLEDNIRKRIRPGIMYIFTFLLSMYAFAIYNPDIWGKIGQVVLSSLLAYALWQKVQDDAPFLLDPTQAPPPRISLADGLIATLSFFVLQGLIFFLCFNIGDKSQSESLLVSFTSSGSLVFLVSLYIFWRRKIPHFMTTVGLKSDGGISNKKAFGLGLISGSAAGIIGFVYLKSLDFFEPLHRLIGPFQKQQALAFSEHGTLLIIAIFAAPLFEEFIFRGIVFRGLRRSVNPLIAIFASAAIFAIVHPALSVIPVFVLGIAAAASFEKTKVLAAPIATHIIYNAIVLSYQFF